jgi:hypothetical protein
VVGRPRVTYTRQVALTGTVTTLLLREHVLQPF